MAKKIRVNKHGLMVLKEVAPEVDEFELGQESNNPPLGGNYCHVNEGYCTSKLKNVDLSDVGEVQYEWDFDEDEYMEWLQDNELVDSEEVRRQYYTEEVTYDVSYYDNETYHYMCGDQFVMYSDLEELFGENMAQQILSNCINNGEGRFETYELYENETYDINNPQELNDIAMKLFSHGEYYKGCRGFILSNGVVVYTPSEHNEICMIPGVNSKFDFVELGNIRVLPNSIDIGREPTSEQEEVLRKVIASYSDERFYLDIFDKGGEIGAEYVRPNWRYVMGEIDRYYSEGIRPQGGNNFYESKNNGSIIENITFEVDSSDVDLSSFKKRTNLCPQIWNDDETLNLRVRMRLLDVADDFWEFVGISWTKPKNILLCGSICNFNWSQFSDIDLHLVVDFNEIDEKTEFVRDFLDGKKNEWNETHKGLKIFNYPIEIYVQDANDDVESGGIYDLEENAWVRKPNESSIISIGLNKFSIKEKAASIMTIIDGMYEKLETTSDSHEIEEIGEDARYLWKKVKDMRKQSLQNSGEGGNGNIVYKILRRTSYLEKLWKLSNIAYDKVNSIHEGISKFKDVIGLLKEEIVADGNSEHNPYAKRWKAERKALKDFICNFGKIMTSKENGKQYKCYYDKTLSSLIGYNYCICLQWDPITLKPSSTLYIRALDKFTARTFQAQYDDRGRDNLRGTYDDIGTSYQPKYQGQMQQQ